MRAAFYHKLLQQGEPLADVAKKFNLTIREIKQSLRDHNLYQMACRLDLKEETANVVRNPRKFNVTTLTRIFDTPAGRQFFGIEITEDGKVLGKIDPNEFKKGFKKAVSDIAAGVVDSRTLNSPSDIEGYLRKFSSSEKPDLSKKGSFDSTGFLLQGPSVKPSRAAKAAKKQVPRKTPKGLIPTSMICNMKIQRVQDLFTELRRLSPAKFPNACAFAFRCFLELSVYSFLNSNGEIVKMTSEARTAHSAKNAKLPPTKRQSFSAQWTPTLNAMLRRIAHPRQSIIPQAHITKALKKVIQNEQSLFELNLIIHNPAYHPNERQLRDTWRNFEEFFKVILA